MSLFIHIFILIAAIDSCLMSNIIQYNCSDSKMSFAEGLSAIAHVKKSCERPVKLPEKPKCKDPSTDELNKMLFDFMIAKHPIYIQLVNMNERNARVKILKFKEENCMKPLYCTIYQATTINEMGLCPWDLKLKYRDNIYPSILQEAKCRCYNCLHQMISHDDTAHGCKPITIKKLALLRSDKCGDDGIYEWLPVFEEVAIACECLALGGLMTISK